MARKKTKPAPDGPVRMHLSIYQEGRIPREIKEVVTFGIADAKFLIVDAAEDGLIRKHVFNMDYFEGYDVLMPPAPVEPTIH